MQTALVRDQDILASVEGVDASNVIAVHRALGGGWEIRYGIRRGSAPAMVTDVELIETGEEAENVRVENVLPPPPEEKP